MAGFVSSRAPHTAESRFGGWRPWIIWGSAALFYLYEFFLRVAPSVMEPELQASFRLTAGSLGFILGIYYYVYAPMQLVVGLSLDRFGARYTLFPAALICAAGSFMEVAGASSWMLGGARLLQGFGSAFGFVGTVYLATVWFPPRRLALLSGLTNALGVLGAIVANAGIAKIVDTMGWRITLVDAGFIGLFVALAVLVFIPKTRSTSAIDDAGRGETGGAFSLLESLKLVLTNPQNWLIGLVATALYVPLTVLGALWGVQYIVAISNTDKLGASLAVSLMYVGWLVGGPASGWLSDHWGKRRSLLLVSCLITALTTAVLLVFSSLPLWGVYVMMFLIGLATSPQIIAFAAAVEANPRSMSGTALAVVNMIVMLLGGLFQPLVGIILDLFSGPSIEAATYSAIAYRIALVLMPASALLGAVAAARMRETYSDRPAF